MLPLASTPMPTARSAASAAHLAGPGEVAAGVQLPDESARSPADARLNVPARIKIDRPTKYPAA